MLFYGRTESEAKGNKGGSGGGGGGGGRNRAPMGPGMSLDVG